MNKLSLVSLGPGDLDLVTPRARAAIETADVVIGYRLYLDLISEWTKGGEVLAFPLTEERLRAEKAIELARSGRSVALVSSGDIGIYGMATLVFELLDEGASIEVEVIPGVTAASSAAALLGAPLAHDFATLSLSDLLCPWEWIEQRARKLAEADLVVALYNVQSRARKEGVRRVLEIFLKLKSERTRCGVVRNAYREGQRVETCTLGELLDREFDMLTTIVIGNRFTRENAFGLFSPRGYLDWQEGKVISPGDFPPNAVWVFSGTHDGNDLALAIARTGHRVIVSVATEYGRKTAEHFFEAESDLVVVINGACGSETRREWLESSRAAAVVDATHPFAEKISRDLVETCGAAGIPCFRFERAMEEPFGQTIPATDFDSALAQAVAIGSRIFLATGSKEIGRVTGVFGASEREWFVRLTPDEPALKQVLAAGIPRKNLCLMQGPFSQAFNEAQWRDWRIDAVVTRESGKGSGFREKLAAAEALGIPVIVIRRPAPAVSIVCRSVEEVVDRLKCAGAQA